MKCKLIGLVLLFVALSATALAQQAVLPDEYVAGATGGVLRIGTLSPLSGPYAADGKDIANGVRVAVAVYKEKGGIPGYDDIEVISEDSSCDGRQAVAGANQLLSVKPAGVIGCYCSSATIPASEVLDEGPIPMITPASTNPKVTGRGLKHVWRMCDDDKQQSIAAAKFLANRLHAKSVYIVDDKTTYAQYVAEAVADRAREMGVRIAGHEHVNSDEANFTGVLNRIKAANPDVIYLSLQNYAKAAPFMTQYKQAGLAIPILTQDAVFHPRLIEAAGAASQGLYATFGYIPDGTPEYKSFVSRYKQMTGVDPGGYAFYSYDAAMAILTAIEKARSTDPNAIRSAMLTLDLQGLTKRIKFYENGESPSNYMVFQVQGDQWKPYHDPHTGKDL